jgi:aerotaxis receptor
MMTSADEILLHETDILVTSTDKGGRIRFANQGFIRVCGHSAEELIGSPHNIIRHPDMPKQAFADLWANLKAGRTWRGLVKNRAKDGRFYWVQANVAPVLEKGEITGFISVRNKPAPDDIARADELYRQIKAGTARGGAIEGGQWVPSGPLARLRRALSSLDIRTDTSFGLLILCQLGAEILAFEKLHPLLLAATIAPSILLSVGLRIWVLRLLRGALDRMERQFEATKQGDYLTSFPLEPVREFGTLTAALRALRLHLAFDSYQKQELRDRVDQEKRSALRLMAESVESEMSHAVEQVSRRMGGMAAHAGDMADSAAAVGGNSQNVAAAAEQTMSNVQSVSASTEELSAAIGEIGRQVAAGTRLNGHAVTTARDAGATIGQLAESVERIGTVAVLINDIASQTNLLALNATIEAARAGEAGKGFAVVAGEVKTLADQTARATQDIARQIGEIQATTRAAVDAVGSITGIIHDVEEISVAIAGAIEEQAAATTEISRNLNDTALAVNEVTQRIADVSSEAGNSGVSAREVSAGANEVAVAVEHLRQVLTRVVRTAAPEVNRRRHPRYALDREATVEAGDRTLTVRLENISEGGAQFEPGLFNAGQTLQVAIPGLAGRIEATVLAKENGHCHVCFAEAGSPDFSRRLAEMVRDLEPLGEAA